MPSGSIVATFTNRKVIAAKRALTVMASHTALSSTRGMVIGRLGSSDLAPLWQSRFHLMTIIAGQLLRRPVFGVAEVHTKGGGPLGSSRVAAELVAGTTRGNIPAPRFRAWHMTAITSRMRVEANRNRQRDAAPCRTVASGATHTAHVQVSRVIEVHAEALQPGKRLERAGAHISVANRADRTLTVRKLLRVTPGAGHVPRTTRQVWPG